MHIIAPTQTLRVPLVPAARVVLCPIGMKRNPARLDMNVEELLESADSAGGAAPPYFIPDVQGLFQQNAAVVRKVQVVVPASPETFWAVDVLPETLGPGRLYKVPPFAPGQTIKLSLAPWQWLIAGAITDTALSTIIVSYGKADDELMRHVERFPVP